MTSLKTPVFQTVEAVSERADVAIKHTCNLWIALSAMQEDQVGEWMIKCTSPVA